MIFKEFSMSPYNVSNQPGMEEGFAVIIVLLVMMAIFIGLLISVLMTWAYCRICSKAGYSWALGLLMLVPIANFVLPLYLAFSDWPLHKEMRQLKSQTPSTR